MWQERVNDSLKYDGRPYGYRYKNAKGIELQLYKWVRDDGGNSSSASAPTGVLLIQHGVRAHARLTWLTKRPDAIESARGHFPLPRDTVLRNQQDYDLHIRPLCANPLCTPSRDAGAEGGTWLGAFHSSAANPENSLARALEAESIFGDAKATSDSRSVGSEGSQSTPLHSHSSQFSTQSEMAPIDSVSFGLKQTAGEQAGSREDLAARAEPLPSRTRTREAAESDTAEWEAVDMLVGRQGDADTSSQQDVQLGEEDEVPLSALSDSLADDACSAASSACSNHNGVEAAPSLSSSCAPGAPEVAGLEGVVIAAEPAARIGVGGASKARRGGDGMNVAEPSTILLPEIKGDEEVEGGENIGSEVPTSCSSRAKSMVGVSDSFDIGSNSLSFQGSLEEAGLEGRQAESADAALSSCSESPPLKRGLNSCETTPGTPASLHCDNAPAAATGGGCSKTTNDDDVAVSKSFPDAETRDKFPLYNGSWIEAFVRAGLIVYAMDLQGHGLSDGWLGRRCEVEDIDDYADDLAEVLQHVIVPNHPDVPLGIIGVSLSGMVTMRALESKNLVSICPNLRMVMLISPVIKKPLFVTTTVKGRMVSAAITTLSHVIPRKRVLNGNHGAKGPEWQQAYGHNDPYQALPGFTIHMLKMGLVGTDRIEANFGAFQKIKNAYTQRQEASKQSSLRIILVHNMTDPINPYRSSTETYLELKPIFGDDTQCIIFNADLEALEQQGIKEEVRNNQASSGGNAAVAAPIVRLVSSPLNLDHTLISDPDNAKAFGILWEHVRPCFPALRGALAEVSAGGALASSSSTEATHTPPHEGPYGAAPPSEPRIMYDTRISALRRLRLLSG